MREKVKFTDKKYNELRDLKDKGLVDFYICYDVKTYEPSIVITKTKIK